MNHLIAFRLESPRPNLLPISPLLTLAISGSELGGEFFIDTFQNRGHQPRNFA
jgi:hypothetical protein